MPDRPRWVHHVCASPGLQAGRSGCGDIAGPCHSFLPASYRPPEGSRRSRRDDDVEHSLSGGFRRLQHGPPSRDSPVLLALIAMAVVLLAASSMSRSAVTGTVFDGSQAMFPGCPAHTYSPTQRGTVWCKPIPAQP